MLFESLAIARQPFAAKAKSNFDVGYLGYEAQDGIDWVWEHRIDDFEQLGV